MNKFAKDCKSTLIPGLRYRDALKMIEKGAILDGKTLTAVLLYARQLSRKKKK